jgi:hypothetical protein
VATLQQPVQPPVYPQESRGQLHPVERLCLLAQVRLAGQLHPVERLCLLAQVRLADQLHPVERRCLQAQVQLAGQLHPVERLCLQAQVKPPRTQPLRATAQAEPGATVGRELQRFRAPLALESANPWSY